MTSIPAAFFKVLSHLTKSAGKSPSRYCSKSLMNSKHVFVVHFVRCCTLRTLRTNFSRSRWGEHSLFGSGQVAVGSSDENSLLGAGQVVLGSLGEHSLGVSGRVVVGSLNACG